MQTAPALAPDLLPKLDHWQTAFERLIAMLSRALEESAMDNEVFSEELFSTCRDDLAKLMVETVNFPMRVRRSFEQILCELAKLLNGGEDAKVRKCLSSLQFLRSGWAQVREGIWHMISNVLDNTMVYCLNQDGCRRNEDHPDDAITVDQEELLQILNNMQEEDDVSETETRSSKTVIT